MPHDEPATRPNILLICTDQHRYDALGCYRNPVVETPRLDRLAAEGVLFENCSTTSPVCAPARASMMTGRFPQAHGLWANGVSLPPDNPLLGRILAAAGYDCGLVGRCHLAAAYQGRTERRFDDGFRFFEWSNDPAHTSPDNGYHRWLRANFPDLWASPPAEVDDRPGHAETPYADMPTEAHYSRWVADRTIRYLTEERRGDSPFFFVANFFDPHHPFVAPQEYLDRYLGRSMPEPIPAPEPDDGAPDLHARLSAGEVGPKPGYAGYATAGLTDVIVAYYAMITLIDDEIARMLAALDELGFAEDTLVIFTSDHGEMLGDHGQILKGPLFYEGAVRVPMIMRWPDGLPAGERRDALVQSLDVFATILRAAGLEPPEGTQALDLLPVARGERAARTRDWALCTYRDSGFPLDPPVHATMLRDDAYKIVVPHGFPSRRQGELYDLRRDPREQVNRWNDPAYAEARRERTERLLDVLVGVEDRSASREAPW